MLNVLVMVFGVLISATQAHAAPVRIVAAEGFYGDIATQIGGPDAAVESILVNPDQDPHQFEASASIARKLAEARIVIYNGLGYDEWVTRLLSSSRAGERRVIEVAALAGRKKGDNPHLWYDVRAVAALADALTKTLATTDAARAAQYTARHVVLGKDLDGLAQRIVSLRARFAGTPVTATEPVFGYMAEALGLDMRNQRFQLAVMNETEPSASDIAAFEQDLRQRRVKALIFNRQTSGGIAERLHMLARDSGVLVVAVTETKPAGQSYQAWMHAQLDALEEALGRR
jgi:zinc/manganese transport system substrate-binding protein